MCHATTADTLKLLRIRQSSVDLPADNPWHHLPLHATLKINLDQSRARLTLSCPLIWAPRCKIRIKQCNSRISTGFCSCGISPFHSPIPSDNTHKLLLCSFPRFYPQPVLRRRTLEARRGQLRGMAERAMPREASPAGAPPRTGSCALASRRLGCRNPTRRLPGRT